MCVDTKTDRSVDKNIKGQIYFCEGTSHDFRMSCGDAPGSAHGRPPPPPILLACKRHKVYP